ncbi:MAG: HEAT repeat domain-containing protein [Candidatus Sumerlaeia bacterium]|nr:HEAT repeat domain-containing protein [Candidatus Sumerlaeia bacterium]
MLRMKNLSKTVYTLGSATLLLALSATSLSGEPVRLLLLTGGHPYDLDEFHAIFDNMEDVEVTHIELEDHSEVFEDIAAWPYDTIVFYNMTQELSDRRLENIFTLTEWGVGMVPLHHGTLSWFGQPRIKEIFGVQFPDVGPFGFHLNQTFTYNIVDPDHPVTHGMEDWEAIDETYTNWYGEGVEGNRVLIKTDHEPSDPELVWDRHVNNSRILTIVGGHDRFMFENPNYNELLYRAVLWTSGRLPLEVGGEGLPNSTIYREYYELPALIDSFANYDASESRAALVAVEDRLADGQGGEILNAIVEVVNDDSRSMAVRTWGMRQLGYYGTPANLEAVAGLLLNEEMANITRYAMEKSVHQKADELLLAAYSDASGDIRQGIAITLTQRKSDHAVQTLASLLGSDDENDILVAASGLGKLGGQDALQALEEKEKEVDGKLRVILHNALLSWAGISPGPDADRILADMKDRGASPIIRGNAWRGYLNSSSEAAGDLATALKSDEQRIRTAAINALVELPSSAFVSDLVDHFPSMSSRDQLGVLYALEERADASTLPVVHAALGSDDPDIVANAIYVAGSFGTVETARAIIAMISEMDMSQRSIAVESLAHLAGDEINPLLVSSLEADDPVVRVALLESLEKRLADEKLDSIFVYTEDEVAQVRAAAYNTLGQLGDDGTFDRILEKFIGLDVASDERFANRAMTDLRRRSDRQDEQLDQILAVLPELSESKANLLIGTIATGSTDAAAKALDELVGSESESLRLAAIRSLSNWPNVRPAETLLGVAELERPRESTLATRGYLTLLARDTTIRSEDRLDWTLRAAPYLTSAALKTQYIAVVSANPSLEALEEVSRFLEDSDVQREAFLAIQQLAPDLSLIYPDEVLAALEQMAESEDLDEELREMARERIDFLAEYSERVMANWNFFAGADGWIAENQSTIELRGGMLHVISHGDDPYISTTVDIEEQPLLLQFRVRHEDEPRLFQFFMRTTELNMGEPGSVLSIQPRRSEGDWVEYEVPFETEGSIQEFRFDFAIVPDVSVDIDYIRILRN